MRKQKTAELIQGAVELLALRILRSGPLNGWDIMQRIQVVSGEVLSVTPGALYPALHRLEARGLVAAEWGASENNRQAKFYRLTAAGGGGRGAREQAGGAVRGRGRGDTAGRVSRSGKGVQAMAGGLWRRLRALLRRSKAERELDAEL